MNPSSLTPRRRAALLLASVGLSVWSAAPHLAAVTYNWNGPVSGGTSSWDTPANWNPNSGFPNAAGDVANVTLDITGNTTINLNQLITLGVLTFGDPNGSNGYTLAAGTAGSFLFDNGAANGQINHNKATAAGTDAISAPIAIGGNGNLEINNNVANGFTISGLISGTGNLLTNGSSTQSFVLTNTGNSYTGATTIKLGNTVRTGANDVIPNGSALTVNGQLILANGAANFNETVGSLSGAVGAALNANGGSTTGTSTLTTGGLNTSTTFAGVISDTGGAATGTKFALNKVGTGDLTLSGANTFTGATNISGGTLVAGNVNALANSSLVSISTTTGGGTLRLATDTSVAPYLISGSSSNAGTIVSDRATAGAGITHALGAVTFGANTFNFTAGANVTSGTAGVSLASLNLSAGVAGTTTLNPTTANLTIAGGVSIGSNNNAKTLGLGGTSAGNAVNGSISNGLNTLSVVKSGTSTWALSGANTYTGATTLTGGTLVLSGSSATSGITINGGTNTTLLVTNPAATGPGQITTSAGATTPIIQFRIDGGGVIALPNSLAGNSGVINTIDVNNNGSGSNGVIQLNGAGGTGVGNATYNITGGNGYSLSIADLRATGGGSGAITFNPTTANVNLGNLTPTTAAATNVYTWTLGGTSADNSVTGIISNGTATSAVTKNGTSTWTLSGANTYTGTTTVNAGGVLRISNDSTLGATGAGTSQTNIIGNIGGTGRVELTGNITTGETFQIDGRQAGSDNTPALSNFSGNNTVTAQALGNTGGGSYNIESQSGLLTLAGGFTQAAGTGPRTWKLMGAGDGDVSGPITNGTGQIVVNKMGAGTWTLSSNGNNYTGGTNVNQGTLLINGDQTAVTGLVSVGAGATLGGIGIIGGNVNVLGTLAPGTSPGVLTVNGDVLFGSGSTYTVEVDGLMAGSGYDQLAITGAGNTLDLLAAGNNLEVDLGFTPDLGTVFTLATVPDDGAILGFFESANGANISAGQGAFFNAGSSSFLISYLGAGGVFSAPGGNDLAIMVIPEPGRVALLGMSALFMTRRRRK